MMQGRRGSHWKRMSTEQRRGGHQQSGEAVSTRLVFRGFEVKTIKLVLAKEG